VILDKTGRPIQYELDLKGDGSYPVQTKWYDGNVTTGKQPFQPIRIGSANDPQKPRRLNGDVMQGNYDAHEGATYFVKASWSLKRVVAPCDRPPGIPTSARSTQKCRRDDAAGTHGYALEPARSESEAVGGRLQRAAGRISENAGHLEAWRAAIPICAIEGSAKSSPKLSSQIGGERAELTEALGR